MHAVALAVGVSTPVAMAYNPVPTQTGEYFVVQQASGISNISVGGTVIPYKEVTFAAQLPGRVTELKGIEGDAFKKGSLLVMLDTVELMAKRRAAEAQMISADAQLRNAGVQFNRELWSPRADTPPGGMGMPNLFDQMFTKPMESWGGAARVRSRTLFRCLFIWGAYSGSTKCHSADASPNSANRC